MVLMVEPIYKAIKDIKKRFKAKKSKIILLSAKGKKFDQKMTMRFSLTLIENMNIFKFLMNKKKTASFFIYYGYSEIFQR